MMTVIMMIMMIRMMMMIITAVCGWSATRDRSTSGTGSRRWLPADRCDKIRLD